MRRYVVRKSHGMRITSTLHFDLTHQWLEIRRLLHGSTSPFLFWMFSRFSTERVMQLLRSELQLPSAWRRRLSDWRLRLRPCDSWLARHTNVRGPALWSDRFLSLATSSVLLS